MDTVTVERTATHAADILPKLRGIVGAEGVLTSFEDRQFYSLDFSEEPGAVALAVVKPTTVEQVSAVVAAASAAGIAVNTRGGGMS